MSGAAVGEMLNIRRSAVQRTPSGARDAKMGIRLAWPCRRSISLHKQEDKEELLAKTLRKWVASN